MVDYQPRESTRGRYIIHLHLLTLERAPEPRPGDLYYWELVREDDG